MMQPYLTPKDVAKLLGVCEATARSEMRKMQHKPIGGKSRPRLRVSLEAFRAYMQPDEPLPRPQRKPHKRADNNNIRLIPYKREEAKDHV
jgi:hypothetical protein